MIGDRSNIDFVEKGNGFPRTGDLLVDHAAEKAYKVLSVGPIRTYPVHSNECTLDVEELDYEDLIDDDLIDEAWEI